MKEIRVRAWDKKDEYMMYFDKMAFGISHDAYHTALLCEDVSSHGDLDWAYDKNEDLILMLFTGEIAGNKRIYEGDIVKGYEPTSDTNYEIPIGIIKFDEAEFYIEVHDNPKTNYANLNQCTINKTIEKIGNIYENPELLKK
jgi:uncharacterized phage protein (TIGR01671 family)